MKVWVSQIYIEVGANFPFSHLWQRWMSRQLSSLVTASSKFAEKYGSDFELMIRISARRQLTENDIRGPAIYRKSKNVEYTLFLPYEVIMSAADGCRIAMEFILQGIQDIFARVNIAAEGFDEGKNFIIDHICSDATMLEKPWPK